MRWVVCLFGGALLAGCASWPVQSDRPPEARAEVLAAAPQPAHAAAPRGSLYAEAQFQSITSDRRLHKAGDLVTVIIFENASASSTADTGANRDASAGINIAKPLSTKDFGLSTSNDFTGVGRTQRSGKVLGQLTVSVREVVSNGDLLVAGEQVLDVNGERQVMRLEGRVRPRDISELNTVLSSRVADARISFSGDGVVGERQRPGWWHQVLTFVGF